MKGGVLTGGALLLLLHLHLHLLLVSVSAAALGGSGGLTGGWKPIKDLKDPHVKGIAAFAVTQYNAQSHAKPKLMLKLKSVVKGETQVVSGINYRLILAVKPSGKYEAVVWEKAWLHYRNLTSFKSISKP